MFKEYCQRRDKQIIESDDADFLNDDSDQSTGSVKSSDMRMARPRPFDHEASPNVLNYVMKNIKAIKEVLDEHPELAHKLQQMIKDHLMSFSGIDYYRMGSDTFGSLDKSTTSKASQMVHDIKR